MPSPSKPDNTQATSPDQWVDLYGDYLYRFALGRVRNPHEAENLVQETFLAALSAHKTFAGKSSERTWLIGILKHKIVDNFRKNYREKPITDLQDDENTVNSFFDITEHPKNPPGDWMPEPSKLLENKEFWKTFRTCLEDLPETAHRAFLLREVEQVDSKEIRKVMNISDANLWVILHRARLQLKKCLQTHWFTDHE